MRRKKMENREVLENLKRTDAEIDALSNTILNELTRFIKLLTKLFRIKNNSRSFKLLTKLLKLMKMRWSEKERVMAAVSRLDSSLFRSILWDYYINNESVIAIARKNHYSEPYIYELLREAEKELKL